MTKLSNYARQAFVQIATVLALACALLTPALAGSHNVDDHKVVIQAFTKSATRVCDKITYSIRAYILTDGTPAHVVISDVWPNGLLPASAINFSGNTSSPPSVFVNSGSWSAQFDTPTGVGPTVTNYTLSFTSTIDPAALNGGDFKMVNQAKIALGRSSPAYERSDDPALSGQEDKTILNIPVAEVKSCMSPPPPPPEAKSCLNGDAKVTCGEVYGTYNITLNVSGAGGVVPSFVQISPTTPGISLVPALSKYPVVGGQVHITVAGATLGQVLNFNVLGTTAGGGSAYGTDLCCNGKIIVTIPKDLDCPPPPTKVDVKKYCDPVRKDRVDLKAPTYSSICHIKVTTTGAVPNPINISEILSGTGTTTYLNSNPATDPWSCLPASVPGGTPMNCTLPGNTMTGPADVSIIDVKVTFPTLADAKEAKNCAIVKYDGQSRAKSCTDFHGDDGKVEIIKKCEPLRAELDGPVLGQGLVTRCKITVHTTGTVTYPLNVAEVLSGTGTVDFVSLAPPSVWTCTPLTASAPAPINCVANGGLNNTSSTSEFEFDVHFPNAAAANESTNCGVVHDTVHADQKSCVPFGIKGTMTVEKICDPVSYHKYPVNDHTTGIGFVSMCHIKVTTTGPQSGVITVNDTLSGGGTVISSSAPAPWTCASNSCTANGGTLNQVSSTSIIDVLVVFPTAGHAQESKNCAKLSTPGQPALESCTGFPPPHGDIKIVKICDPARKVGDAVVSGYQAMCHITVTTTGPQTGTISVGDILSGAGTLGNATAPAPWTCTGSNCQVNGSNLNQTSSTTVIDVPVTFPLNNGQGQEAKNCANVKVGGNLVGESCTPIVIVGDYKFGKLIVTKEASYNGNHILNVNFPINVTCGGNTTNGNVQDSVPYTQSNIPLGTQCSVVETTIPATGLCPKGQTEVWTTTYAPTGPVGVSTPAGTTIAIRNILDCRKDEVGTRDISKVCDPVTEVVGAKNRFESKCHITVTTTGPQTGLINVADSFMGIGNMNAATAPAPWTCSAGACTVNGNALNQTSSSSAIDVTITFNNAADAIEAKNCAEITTDEGKRSCTGFTVKTDSQLYVKKVVVNHAPGSVAGLQFWIEDNCNSSQSHGQAYLKDGDVVHYKLYEAGVSCQIYENSYPATTACGNDTPVWSTTYSPSQTIALTPNGEMVTVTNTLDCRPVDSNPIKVKKVVINNSPRPIDSSLQFPITVTCVKGTNGDVLDTDATHTVADGQTVTYLPYAAGFSCSAHEGTIPQTDVCGKDKPVWTTAYSAQPVAMTPTGETITVTNTLNCEPVVKGGTTFSVRKDATFNGNPINNVNFPMTVTCGKGGTTQNMSLTNGQSKSLSNLPNGTTCQVVEGTIPQTGLCPKGTTERWVKSYTPASGSNTTSTQSSVVVTVHNELQCKKIVIDNPVCGPGTHLEGTVCVKNVVKCAPPAVRNPDTNTCYVPRPDCKQGTHWNGKSCVPDKKECRAPLVLNPATNICYLPRPDCKEGTHWDGRNCIPDRKVCRAPLVLNQATNTCYLPKPNCPDGTHWNGKRCVQDRIVCQPGTHLEGNKCVRNEQKCGPRQIKTKRGCIDMPKCGAGQIPVPGTGICVDIIKRREPKGPVDGQTPKRGGGIGLPGLGGLLTP